MMSHGRPTTFRALQKAGDEVLHLFALSHDDDLVSVADRFVGRAVQGDTQSASFISSGASASSQRSKPSAEAWAGKYGVWYSDILAPAAAWELRVSNDLPARRIAIRPAVICPFFECVERLVRFLQAEMVRTLTGRPEKVADPFKPDRVAQSAGKFPLVRAVRIHFDHAGSHLFFLDAGVTARSHRYVQFSRGRERDRPRQVPAAVFIAQAVIGKGRKCLRLVVARASSRPA